MESDADVESGADLAPPVVAVVVVHDPGPWFDETVASIAAQDYPNLNTLFLLTTAVGATTGDHDALRERIVAQLPDAFVRDLAANPGFGPAANEVLRLVEGDSGFFCVCHDDLVLEPDTVRLLVEELYRSNAGVVGPKLVSWDDAGVLAHVGLGLDRFGEIDPITEPGEYDQEQHDAVADVFALPSACLLVRADLFRSLGGFDPSVNFHGDDVDLCWRIHLSGARVVVAPQARVRHREELEVRRPDLHHDLLRARHRLRTLTTLTGGARLPVRLLQIVLLTAIELVVGVFTGRLSEAWSSTRAVVGLLPRAPGLLARRGAISKIRRVGDAEILDLQIKGSARLTSFRRAHDTETYIGTETNVRRWRESSLLVTMVWLIVLAGILLASRSLIDERVPSVGELLPLPASPGDLWSDFAAAWNPGGLGQTVANPTGWAVVSVASILWLFRMGLGLTMIVVGLVLLGVWGAWRLATVFPSSRARITALLVYAAVPVVPGIISTGRLSALVAYAVVPWFVHLLRVAVGIGTADPASAADDLVDGVIRLSARERVRRTAMLAVVAALAVAMAPGTLIVLTMVVVVLGVTTLAVGAGLRTAGWMTGLGVVAAAVAFVLNLPWSLTWSWADLTAAPLAGPAGRGLVDTASMTIGQASLEVLALALYLPVLIALAVSRAWRLTWAARAGGLVVMFLTLAVLQDRDALPFSLPEPGMLLVPVALGLALAGASAVAAFGADVAGRTFGWRQPLGLVAVGAVAVGLFPAVLTVLDGAWFMPPTSTLELVQGELPSAAEVGDYRILYIGDPRLIPFPSADLGGGVAMALVEDEPTDLRDRWPVPDQPTDDELRAVVELISTSATQRGGRLLAPFDVRFIIVPLVDGASSTGADELPVPIGLLEAFGGQLDLTRSIGGVADYVRFENRAVLPTQAVLDGPLAEASQVERVEELVAVDTSGAVPTMTGVGAGQAAAAELTPGVLHHGTPLDSAWRVQAGAGEIAGRTGFGVATAYDIATGGPGVLRYDSPPSRTAWLVALAAMWALTLLAASRLAVPARLRVRRIRDETLLDLDAEPGAGPPVPEPPERSGFGGWVEDLPQAEVSAGRDDDAPEPPEVVDDRPQTPASLPADVTAETNRGPAS